MTPIRRRIGAKEMINCLTKLSFAGGVATTETPLFNIQNELSKIQNVEIESKKWRSSQINLPKNPDSILKKLYGQTWQTPIEYKVSDRVNLSTGLGISFEKDDLGYAGSENQQVIIGLRDVKVNQAMLEMNYNILGQIQ